MPSRPEPFVNGQIYHLYNRGIEKRLIFLNDGDFKRFLRSMVYYSFEGPKPKFSRFTTNTRIDSNKRIVEIICYCLMPNHFHLVVKQLKDGGITEFISKFTNSYTKFFNTKHPRVGPLFQGEFKSVLVESEEQLIHLTRYIHLNPYVADIVKNPRDYEWSSYSEYSSGISKGLCSKQEVLSSFSSKFTYEQFVMDYSEYAQSLERVKHQLVDINDI